MFHLIRLDGPEHFELRTGARVILGRGPTCDCPVPDPTISRQHAELAVIGDEVEVTDLGSSNGTQVNGKKISRARARALDTIIFGRATFRLEPVESLESRASVAGGTIVRALKVQSDVRDALNHLDERSAQSHLKLDEGADRGARKLSLLLDLSQRLSGELDLDRLLESVATTAFEVFSVDRVAILLADPVTGALVPRVSRSVLGDLPARAVPRSIADRVVKERVAVLSDNAAADSRFSGKSIALQSVRSAMCTPLMGSADRVLGILYVDSVTASNSFSDEDLQFLVAFGGIAAAGIRTSLQAEELRSQAVVRGTFERYFAPEVAAQIARNAGAAQLGGDRRPIAVLFSDVRGFTRLAEGMTPEALAALLSDYFTEMVDVVFEHGGTLDKFVGDAIMALWGAPAAQPDAADRALRAAVGMLAALTELNARWAAQGRPPLEVGVGINYGEVFAGNIGSHRRLEYTVLGDVVNVAARLCAEAGPGEILVGSGVRDALRGEWPLELLPARDLRGREGKVEIYRVK
jgi:adenylate cyclase